MKVKYFCFFQYNWCIFILFLGVLFPTAKAQEEGRVAPKIQSLANNPFFIENVGQIQDVKKNYRSDIKFKFALPNGSVYFQSGEINFVYKSKSDKNNKNGERIDLIWLGANKQTNIQGIDASNEKINFIQENESFSARTFEKIIYENIYPNIDLVFSYQNSGLKYDWIVKVGGDPRQIKWRFSGAESAELNPFGEILVNGGFAGITEQKPIIYQYDILDEKTQIAGRFEKNKDVFSFQIDSYDKTKPLIIDPYLRLWSTYFGAASDEGFMAVASDNDGNVIAAGYATADDFPVSFGSFQEKYNGGANDAVLVKFNSKGRRLWATYFGGDRDDQITGVAIDKMNRVCVTGFTESNNLPVSDRAFQKKSNGEYDVFIAQFDTLGKIIWLTYLGGRATDQSHGICVDNKNQLIVVGTTISSDFPKLGPYSREKEKGLSDAFVFKLSNDGKGILSTCFGGTDDEEGSAVAVDSKDEIIITGRTKSANLPVSKKAYQDKYGKGGALGADAYILKLTTSGSIKWATYYGGSDDEEGLGVAVDNQDLVYVCGYTTSKDFPLSGNAQYKINNGLTDAFVLQFNGRGERQFATFIGGEDRDYAFGITTDNFGYAYIAGRTASPNFPVTGGYFKTKYAGAKDAFLAKISSKARVEWAMTFGGLGDDEAGAIAINPNQDIIAVGQTNSDNLPPDTAAYQKNAGGKIDGFVVKMAREACQTFNVTAEVLAPTCRDPKTGSATLKPEGGSPPYTFKWENGDTDATLSNVASGYYYYTVTDTNNCVKAGKVFVPKAGEIQLSFDVTPPSCHDLKDAKVKVETKFARTPITYLWNNGKTSQSIDNLAPGEYDVKITEGGGCVISGKVVVKTLAPLEAKVEVFHPTCFGEKDGNTIITVNGGAPPYSYRWASGHGIEPLNEKNSKPFKSNLTNLAAGNYRIQITDKFGCSVAENLTINEPEKLTVNSKGLNPTCEKGNDGKVFATAKGGTPPYQYQWSYGETEKELKDLTEGIYSVKITDSLGCSVSDTVTLKKPNPPVVNLSVGYKGCDWTSETAKPGYIKLTVTGGKEPYVYEWSNKQTTQHIDNLSAGKYSVNVTDANNCVVLAETTIEKTKPLLVTIETARPDCNTGKGGMAIAKISGGKPPYNLRWSDGSTKQNLSEIPAGKYSLMVTDSLGCVATAETVLIRPKAFVLSTEVKDVSCDSQNDGAVSLKISGGNPPFRFKWSNGEKSRDLKLVPAGKYSVRVVDSAGCEAEISAEIKKYKPLTVKVSGKNVSCANVSDGMAQVEIVEGKAPYVYQWNNGGKAKTINNLSPGLYTVTVTDANNCVSIQSVNIEPVAAPFIQLTGNPTVCLGDTVKLETSAGFTTYLWSNGARNRQIKPSKSGEYTVEVSLPNGCKMKSAPVKITINSLPEKPVITRLGDSLIASSGPKYEWFYNDKKIEKGEQKVLIGGKQGKYTVRVANAEGCSVISEPFEFSPNRTVPEVKVYPNPNQGSFYLDVGAFYDDVNIQIVDFNNKVVYESSGSDYRKWVELKDAPKGLYFVKIKTAKGKYEGRMVIR